MSEVEGMKRMKMKKRGNESEQAGKRRVNKRE